MDELNSLTENVSLLADESPIFDGIHGDLVVRTGHKDYSVHKNVLRKCPYFAAIIDGDWQESHTSEINLQGYCYIFNYVII